MTCWPTCVYCDVHLASQHEHDHMPIPKRYGGEQTFCVCINCHALKDRTSWDDLPSTTLVAMSDAPPLTRIVLAKMFALMLDLKADAERSRAA